MTIAVTTWIAAGAIAGALALAGVQTMRLSNEQAAHATTRASYADERTKAAQAHARATDEQRAIYESRIGAKDEIIAQAHRTAAARADSIARLERAAGGLRDERAAYLARAGQTCSDPGADPRGTTACPAASLLDELFGQADSFAGELAGAFEASRAAGLACETSYDSLR